MKCKSAMSHIINGIQKIYLENRPIYSGSRGIGTFGRKMWPRRPQKLAICKFSKEGCLIPILFVWEDGRKYKIDMILKIERCTSRKAGGFGTMYTCMVQGKESHLFFEVDKWFMERKIS